MNLEEIPKLAVEKLVKEGAEDAAVSLTSESVKTVRYANNEVTTIYAMSTNKLSVYVGVDERYFYGEFEKVDPETVDYIAKRAIEIAKASPKAKIYASLPKGPFEYRPPKPYDKRIAKEEEELVDYVSRAINASLEVGAKRCAGILYATYVKRVLCTTGGVEAADEGTIIELSHRAFANGEASGHWVSCSKSMENFNPEEAGRRAAEVAVKALNPKQVEAGKYDVILAPMIFANLVSEMAMFASAFYVDAGISFLAGKLQQEVASKVFTMVDDPTAEDALFAVRFDDEGVPTKRTPIVENGVLKTYLHNSKTAKKMNAELTGHAGYVVPHPWNVYVKPGTVEEEKLLEKLDKGLYLTNSWYHRYQNFRTGDFSAILRDGAFYVENGEIKYPVKGGRISDNMIRLFSNIETLGDRTYLIKWWEVPIPVYVPAALVRDVNITKAVK